MPPPHTTASTAIPRFLLPQRGSIWRSRLSTPSSSIRHASNKVAPKKAAPKPLVLEKPTKFTPPSHPQKLRKPGPRYSGPALSSEELAAQKTRKYPNMMPPEGTVMHKIITSRSIHLYFSLSTLFTLATFVWITNFKNSSPFADMLPSWTQLFIHPIAFFRTFFEVIRLDAERTTAETMERRKRKVEDVQKRAAYRKAHGLDKEEGFGGWTAKTTEEMLGPGIPVGDMVAAGVKAPEEGEGRVDEGEGVKEKKPLKKWLGIW